MDLFETQKPELTRQQKLIKSKKNTSDLTRWAIDFLNDSGQFQVHRSNNFPSQRITREKKRFAYLDENHIQCFFEFEEVKIMFKKGNIKDTILDISGFVLPYNGNDQWASRHIELEVKTGKDSLSDGQIKRIEDICAAGGISFAFNSKEMFLHRIKMYMVDRKLAF